MRRDARRSGRSSLGGGGRLSLRRALGLVLALAGVWLIAAGPLSASLSASAAPSASPQSIGPTPTATPSPTQCHSFGCPTPTPTFVLPTFTPTPTPIPTPTPTPTPTAAPTVPPTPYNEPVAQGDGVQTLTPVAAAPTITPRSNGSGSALPELALLGAVVFAMIAAASFFLFFRIR